MTDTLPQRIEAAEGTDRARIYAAAACAGWAAYVFAVGSGVPRWVDWPSWEVPGDAADIGVLVFAAVRLALRAKDHPND